MKLSYDFENISLRILNESHADMVLRFYLNNQAVIRKYEVEKPDNFYTVPFQQKILAAELQDFIHGKYARFYLFSPNSPDRILGTVSFSDMKRSAFFSCQIGYKIDSSHTHQGYGYAMLRSAMEIMETECFMHRFNAYILPENIPSVKLVQRLGFQLEGTARSYAFLNGKWQDHLLYAYVSDTRALQR